LGLAWLGLAWLGLAWLGLAWLGLAWLGLAWLGLRPLAVSSGRQLQRQLPFFRFHRKRKNKNRKALIPRQIPGKYCDRKPFSYSPKNTIICRDLHKVMPC
ncbi:MAG: hypothetical protein E7050_11455, partial [Lentisphaerae bacterium]|nr:hypothetical protein [Lentisphaerota bacterium]